MIRLFINHYKDENPLRQLELEECLERNMANPLIDEVEKIFGEDRPTYTDLFRIANEKVKENDITIIANADIFFEQKDIALINYFLAPNTCFALSRWDKLSDGSLLLFDREDSQDSWIFKGPIKEIPNADFTMGRPGCDNAICQRIEMAGYSVQNPARDVKSIHLHLSGIRNYNTTQTVEKPYKLIAPHHLPSLPVTN